MGTKYSTKIAGERLRLSVSKGCTTGSLHLLAPAVHPFAPSCTSLHQSMHHLVQIDLAHLPGALLNQANVRLGSSFIVDSESE